MNAITRFPTLPPRLAKLPVSDKGFPVPYFVEWIDGKPDFRVVGPEKMAKAVKVGLCWVCGERLGTHKAFVIGPMCGINRTISDPPSHRDCAIWSAENCPFLSRQLAQRNTKDLPLNRKDAAGFGLKRNPGAVGVWVTKSFKPFRAPRGGEGILFQLGDPEEVLWFANGRQATRAEVNHSIETGLPSLYELARFEGPEAVKALDGYVTEFHTMLAADGKLDQVQLSHTGE